MPEPAPPWTHRGTRAVERMVEYAPSTGGLALWIAHLDLPAAPGPDAAPGPPQPAIETDGRTIRYRAAFESIGRDEQTGLVAHAVLHVALRHAQRYLELHERTGDVDLALFNTCADAIVNSTLGHLGWLALPAGAVRLEQLLVETLALAQDVERSLLEWDVERLYRTIDDRRPPGRRGGDGRDDDGRSEGGRGDDARGRGDPREQAPRDGPRAARVRALGAGTPPDLVPGEGTRCGPGERADDERQWAERLLRAHAGDGPFSLLRTLPAGLARPRTPWEQVLRMRLARGLAPQRELSWSRPSRSYLANRGRAGPGRRMPWEPGFAGTQRVPRLAVVVDVSGSIDDALMRRFAREIEAILRRLGAGLVLVVGDDRVRRVERFGPGRATLEGIVFEGGGDTDFTPLLEEADAHDPDLAVVLTDLDGPARFRPRWPVLWAVPEAHAAAVQPFGRKLVLC
jgi:predicted metal-dependent peptidase